MRRPARSTISAAFCKTSTITLAAACAIAVQPAFAQETPSSVGTGSLAGDSAAADAQGAGQGLADIVVTAQRRRERLQDVPISVTAVDAAIVSNLGIDNAADLSLVAPAVTFQTTINGGGINIRGVGGNAAIGDEPPNAVYVDGVYQAFTPAFLSGFNNIERIEVLKGPQGTLFGRNASGGVVQVVTPVPTFETHIDVTAGYGNYDQLEGSLYAATGLTDHLAADLALSGQQQGDGYGTNTLDGSDIYKGYAGSARGKLYWEAGGNTKVTAIALYSKAQPWESNGGQIYPEYVDRAGGRGAGFRNARRNDNTRFSIEQKQASLSIVHDAGWAELTSITAYDDSRERAVFDQDGTAIALLAFDGDVRSRTWTEELRVQALPSSRINWIGGIFLYNNVVDVDPITIRGAAATGFGGSYSYRTRAPINSYAGFGQVSIPFGATTFTAGGRYTVDDKRIDMAVRNAAGALIPLRFSANPRQAARSFSKFTYRLAVDHKISPDLMVYASLNTGFKAGAYGLVSLSPSGTTEQTTFPDPVDSQIVTAYEAGFKAQLLDNRLRFNLSAYYYDLDDIQLRVAVPGGSVLVNAAKARTKGVDIDTAWRVTPRLTLQGALSYLDGPYTDFPNPPYFRPVVNAAGVATGGLVQFTGANARGNRTVNSPEWVTSIVADYRLPTSVGEFGLVGSYEYNDGYFFDAQQLFESGSRHIFNATNRWKSKDGAVSLSGYVRNILNQEYITSTNTSALGPLYWSNAPRTYGIRAGYKF